jgi:hypothetical protein
LVTIQGNTAIVKNNLPENTRIITTILQKPLIGMKIKSADDTKVAHNKSNENSKREQTTDNKVAQLKK